MKNHFVRVSAFLSLGLVIGCGTSQQDQIEVASPPNVTMEPDKVEAPEPPFEFKEIERDDKPHDLGPQLVITLETTNDVAKKATKDDLRTLWDYFAPEFGDRRAFLYVKTDVPGAGPWAIIRRFADPLTGKIDFQTELIEFGIDAEPYFFPNKIDRNVSNQKGMVLTLPVVNRVVEQIRRHGWDIKRRTEDFVGAQIDNGGQSASLTMTPEHLSFDGYRLDDLIFVDTAASILDELGIGEQVKARLQTVIGSPEYLRAKSGEPAEWTWTIREYEIDYSHTDLTDRIYVNYYK